MNILIVDDEVISVEGIAVSLPWETLGIREVYKAYSMKQAQEVFRKAEIDILLCDIEMPRGSGLDLMEWVRGEGYPAVCIFLTCFSKFEYASRAIRLQIFDYVLKPCEYGNLTEVIRRAVARVCELRQTQEKIKTAEQLEKSVTERRRHFWLDLFAGNFPVSGESLCRELAQRGLPASMEKESFYLLWLQTVPDQEMHSWENSSWQYGVSNIISELLGTGDVLSEGGCFLALAESALFPDSRAFGSACEGLIQTLDRHVPAVFLGYAALPAALCDLPPALALLQENSRKQFSLQSRLFWAHNDYAPKLLPVLPGDRWKNALLSHNADRIVDDIQLFVSCQSGHLYIDRSSLLALYHQLLRVIYEVLSVYHLPHSSLFEREEPDPEAVLGSVPDFLIWVANITDKTVSLISQKENSGSAVDTLLAYILEHLEEDMTRNELAELVHLNPDYLSTLFRQKTGMSMSEYITRERIRRAETLLLSTDMPVSEIATRTGFQTISYFSKQFRRLKNVTPFQFRKNKKNGSFSDD